MPLRVPLTIHWKSKFKQRQLFHHRWSSQWPGHLASLTGKLSAWAAIFLGRTLSGLDSMAVNWSVHLYMLSSIWVQAIELFNQISNLAPFYNFLSAGFHSESFGEKRSQEAVGLQKASFLFPEAKMLKRSRFLPCRAVYEPQCLLWKHAERSSKWGGCLIPPILFWMVNSATSVFITCLKSENQR